VYRSRQFSDNILRDSVVWCDVTFSDCFIENLLECASERVFEIGQYLVEIGTRVWHLLFLTYSVYGSQIAQSITIITFENFRPP